MSNRKTTTTKRNRKTGSLPAKLAVPRLHTAVIRPRLFRKLDEAFRKASAVWVRAPAGAGKTTLVASYARERGFDCLWYQLDARDSDAAAFFYGLREAVAQRRPSARRRLPLLAPEYHAGAPTYARTYFERLGEIMSGPFLLVLDDFQELPADAPLA